MVYIDERVKRCPSQDCPVELQTQDHQPENFRTVPWFILRDRRINGKGVALVLSVVWAAVQGSGTPGLCKITNEEIARRSGIRGGAEEARRYLMIAEANGWLRRHGYHKGRLIRLLLDPPADNDVRGLIIPYDILSSAFSPTEKLLASAIRFFSKASAKWICTKLGISEQTYHKRLRYIKLVNPDILTTSQPPEKISPNPPKKYIQPPEKISPLGIEGTDLGTGSRIISKDMIIGPAVQEPSGCQTSPAQEEPGMPESNYVPYTTPAPPGWLEQQLEIADLRYGTACAKAAPVRLKKPKPPFVPRLYSGGHMADMEWIRNNLPFVHSPARGTRAYENDIRVLEVLEGGPANTMTPGELAKMLNCMSGRPLRGSNVQL